MTASSSDWGNGTATGVLIRVDPHSDPKPPAALERDGDCCLFDPSIDWDNALLPTRLEYYAPSTGPHRVGFEEKTWLLVDDYGPDDMEGFTPAELDAWLAEKMDWDELQQPGNMRLGPYAPGLMLLDLLGSDAERLGLHWYEPGMMSTFVGARFEGNARELSEEPHRRGISMVVKLNESEEMDEWEEDDE